MADSNGDDAAVAEQAPNAEEGGAARAPDGDGTGTGTGTGTEASPVEVEWQFDAVDLRPVERWLAELPERAGGWPELPMLTARAKSPRRLVDRYVDTEDWRLARAGFVLRTRRRGRQEEATLKDAGSKSEDGLRRRLEVTEALPAGGLAALGTEGAVGRRVAAVAGGRPLRQVLEIRTRRHPFSLRAAEEEVAELAIDDTLIALGPGKPPVTLRRVEVEVAPEWADRLAPLVAELRAAAGLTPAARSKFETGLLAAGLAVPALPDLGPTDVRRNATVGDLAFAVLRRQLTELLAHEPGTRLGEDPEELHDMRVATRRLRAAMDLFADALPAGAGALREELRWIAGALGAVRDLDVQLGRVEELERWLPPMGGGGEAAGGPAQPGGGEAQPGGGEAQPGGGEAQPGELGDLRALLRREREAARTALLGALDSERWERVTADLTALAVAGPDPGLTAAGRPAAVVTGELILDRHRRALRAAKKAQRSGQAADFHRLRIRCKRLRYSVEFTVTLYGKPARQFARKLAALQDALGELQDDVVAQGRLHDLAVGATGRAGARGAIDSMAALAPAIDDGGPGPGPLAPETLFAMGRVAEHYRVSADERLRRMPARLGKLDGRSWSALAAAVGRRRDRAGATEAEAHPGPNPPPTTGSMPAAGSVGT